MKFTLFLIAAAFLVVAVKSDCYLHNPRGSNNRLNDKNENAQNQNRLFDSQNNAKGGTHWGPAMHYYVGSVLTVEYHHQHSCGMGNLEDCNMIFQIMCEDGVRDGDATQGANARQTFDPANGDNGGGNDIRGMHENSQYYLNCLARERNKGLFIADQNLNDGIGATSTRQNAGGTRYAAECPEERDYYPYWHPTPWRDLAVQTHNTTRCAFYETESQNVVDKGVCSVAAGNNPTTCAAAGGTWSQSGAWGMPAPECVGAKYSRDNHNGNGIKGFHNSQNITVPNVVHENCVMRIRYNITTADYNAWDIDAGSNGGNSPVTNDPQIDIGDGNNLQLAINTAQFGRTFQDRSHVFAIRPSTVPDTCSGPLFNLNVRGRRGNIEQCYPSVEYDFVPQIIEAPNGACIHIQWTGSDYNDQNAAGEGTAGTDRSNLIQQKDNNPKRMYPAHKDDITMFTDVAVIESLALLGQNDATLNNADPYHDEGIIAFTTNGEYNYMCTRNNNFTNRAQRGTIIVGVSSATPAAAAAIGVGIAILALSAALGGAAIYARSHPSSRVAAVFNRRGSANLSSNGSVTGGARSFGRSDSRGSRGSRGSGAGRSRSKGSHGHGSKGSKGSKGSRSRSR